MVDTLGTPDDNDPKNFLTSKLFWTGLMMFSGSVLGTIYPPAGEFLKDNALLLGGAIGPLVIGLRSVTSQPVTWTFSKKL